VADLRTGLRRRVPFVAAVLFAITPKQSSTGKNGEGMAKRGASSDETRTVRPVKQQKVRAAPLASRTGGPPTRIYG